MDQRARHSRYSRNPFRAGHVFGATLVRNCYGLSGCSPPSTDLTGLPANGGFYFQAFSGSVALPAAGYNYNSVWTPCMGFVKEAFQQATGRCIFFPSSVSLFDLKAVSSSRPALRLPLARAEAVKVGRRTDFATGSAVARPHLDSFEHDGTLGAIGMTIRGEPAFGRGSIAPQPCIRWVQGPEP